MKSSQTNTFTGGMQKDLHPMITPPNVLTDALNATITTMNGNENMLQNDMGNARVENAYLPKNYIPIGVKEYGGIVYIASYNPITKHGQLGCFPSPQRNLVNTFGSNLVWNIQKLLEKKSGEVQQYSVKDTIYNDKIFHPGDMFSLVANLNPFIKSKDNPNPIKITNQLGCKENGNISLGISVLDSNNNLVDITDTLNKYDLSGKINNDSGCIMLNSQGSNVDIARETTQYNVFNSKIAGQLFLVTTLNSIKSVDIELDAELQDSEVTITILANYKYNCRADNILTPIIKVNNTPISETKIISTANFVNRLGINYTQAKYKITIPKSNDITAIQFIPCMKLFDNTTNIMNSLSSTVNINMNKLDTNSCDISDWRYYVNNGRVNLVWGLETYPKKSDPINSIKFKFTNLLDLDEKHSQIVFEKTISGKQSYFGAFSWDIDFLTTSTVYRVDLYRNGNYTRKIGTRYILTTPLMNDCFFQGESNYVPDYGLITKNSTDTRLQNIFKLKNTINVSGDISINRLSQDTPINNTLIIPKLISYNDPQDALKGLKYTETHSEYLVSYIPTIEEQNNYPCTINTDKVNITTTLNKKSQKSSDLTNRDYVLANIIADNKENIIQYNFEGTTLNRKLILNQHFVSLISGNYKKLEHITVNKVFKPLTQQQLFGYRDNSNWWLAAWIWAHKESGDLTGELNIMEVNYPEEQQVLSLFKNNKYSGIRVFDENLSVNQDGGTLIYDKINNYIKESKGMPTVVLWSSRITQLEHGISGISLIYNPYERFYGMEYAWWLGSDSNYYLLQNAYIPPIPNRDPKKNTEVYLPQQITRTVDQLYIANIPTSQEYNNKTFYVVGDYNLDRQYQIDNTLNIQVTPTINSGNNLLYKQSKIDYIDRLTNLNPSQNDYNQLDLFKFTYNQKLNNSEQDFEISSTIQGFEDYIPTIESNKNITNIPHILQNLSNEIFVTDVNGRQLDPSIIYTVDENNKPRPAREVTNLWNLLDLFSIKQVNGINTLVVNPAKTAVKPNIYHLFEKDTRLNLRYFPTAMQSFKIDEDYFGPYSNLV